MNYKRGFTLIELLAVILILGIISVIAIPTITSVIEDSKKGSLKSTASILAEAAEKACQIEQMKGSTITKSYGITNGILSSPLDVKGLPNSGTITVDNECNANVAVANDNYCAMKSDGITSINSNINDCSVEGAEIPVTRESCFIFDETTRTITGYNYSDTTCPSKISIPEKINNIPIEHIEDYAFVNADYDFKYSYGYEEDIDTDFYNYRYYDGNYDLLENIQKLGYSNIRKIDLLDIINPDLKKYCYYPNNTYDEKSYDYLIMDSDTYYGCYFNDIGDEDVEYKYSHGLTALDLSKATNLIDIGDAAFYGNEIEHIKFGILPNLVSLGVSSFDSNYITGTLDLGGLVNLTSINNSAFATNSISNIIFPSSLIEIGMESFEHNNITSLNLPNSLINMKGYSFADNQISTLVIPNSVTYTLEGTFSDNNISSLTLSNNMKHIAAYSFANNQISELNILNNIVLIDDEAFENNLITEISIPNSILYLSGFNDNDISELTIPSSVIDIGEYAFQNNELTSLTIPNNVKNIYSYAFDGNNLNTLSLSGTLLKMDSYAFSNGRGTISSVIIPNSITGISDKLFYKTKITNLTIGDNVKVIGNSAFSGSSISTINWGTKLTNIGYDAFYQCQLVNLVIPSGVIYIDHGAFSYSTKIQTIEIPDSVIRIDYAAFNVTPYLKTVNIGSGITVIGSSGFGCYNDSCGATINIKRAEGKVPGASWGAKNSIINWTGTN